MLIFPGFNDRLRASLEAHARSACATCIAARAGSKDPRLNLTAFADAHGALEEDGRRTRLITPSNLSRWLSGTIPQRRALERLGEVFGIPWPVLLLSEDELRSVADYVPARGNVTDMVTWLERKTAR